MRIIKITTLILAVIQIVLGIIHCSFTPLVMKNIPANIMKVFLPMFLSTGLAIIYSGIVLLREISALRESDSENYKLINISLVFFLLIGLIGVSMMWKNPFAWISIMAGVICSAIIFGAQILAKPGSCNNYNS